MKENKKKKYLLTRFGGIGDIAPVMAVARYLKKQGHSVDLALREDQHGQKQIDFLQNSDCCDNAINFKEYGPSKARVVPFAHGLIDVRGIYKNYDEVIDYMYIVERNNTCNTSYKNKPSDEWKNHRNSNWVNWYDLHFAWANIDPTSVPDEDKRPVFVLSDEEKRQVEKIKAGRGKIITINPYASSLTRTWYQAEKLIPEILKQEPKATIFYWKPDKGVWSCFTKEGVSQYLPQLKSSVRASMCVVGASDLYIGADTGFTHIAEGLGVKHIAIYSSVPWWTRAKYYKNQIHVDKGPHTFSLTLGDPLRVEEGYAKLSAKEKKILSLHSSGMGIDQAASLMNTTEEGIAMELESIKTKVAACERIQSKSLTSVSVKEILELSMKTIKGSIK